MPDIDRQNRNIVAYVVAMFFTLLLIFGIIAVYRESRVTKVKAPAVVTNFETCVAKGYPVLESYPRQCNTPDGKSYVEVVKNGGMDAVACTMDAKMCPDGSAVGRVPPRCEFAPCP